MSASESLNVLQQSTTSNIDQKRQIIFLAKPSEDSLVTNSEKGRLKTMTRVHNPPPVAVARRNARERNRVKQVNNGFATLRQHIPTAIAATYESGNGRGSNKKLSKVETLRMAVEYIKSLEKLLSISEENSSTNSVSDFSDNIAQSISIPAQFNVTYSYSKSDEDRLKKSYHLMYEDEENIHPLKMEGMEDDILRDSSLVTTNLDSNDMSLLHSIDNTASLSPEVYSEHSLSPMGLETNDTKSYIPVFNVPNPNILPSFSQISFERLPQVKSELLSPNAQQTVVDDSASDTQTVCIITRTDNNDNPIDVMWWNQQQQTS